MMTSRSIPVALADSIDIDEHIGFLARQVDRSCGDPETRQLAVKLVSGVVDAYVSDPREGQRRPPLYGQAPVVEAWGMRLRAPPGGPCRPRDVDCEIRRIWDFVVLNVRYVYDPHDVDVFATVEQTLRAGGGDCDDGTVVFAALLKSIGFFVGCRVISVPPQADDWVHVYALVGLPKDNPTKWVPLDFSVKGSTPGWEYDNIAQYRDYRL